MQKIVFLAAALVVAGACSDTSTPTRADEQPVVAAAPPTSTIPDQYIVVFRDNVGDPRGLTDQLATAHGASVRFRYSRAVKGFAASMSANAADALSRNPNVLLVEQDQEVTAIATQTMDGAGDPWGLDRIDARAGLNATYTYALTGAGVRVYIIDSGIRTTHSQFGGRATGGMTAINDGRGTNDCAGHGTHVAGTVGGATYGVAKGVALVAVRVLDCAGNGSWSGVIAGIDWVTANAIKPAVANMSLLGGAISSVDLAVENSIASGVTYAVAAGNGNTAGVAQNACNYSPSRTPNALTIGATLKTDGKVSWSNYGTCVDWFAPGVGIKSAWFNSDTDVNTISGTSMATPHTAGVVALYLQSNPSANPAAVRAALFDALTKSVVTSSNTANNHLLYSPPGGFGTPPTNNAPTAAFTSSCAALTCNFTDGSSDSDGSIQSRSWNFGDGASSTATNPSRTYAASGTYTVTLTVTDNGGATGTTTRTVTVTSPPTNNAPTAAFTSSCTALTCNFTDGSSDSDGTIASRSWNFGDGASSTATNPSRTYATGGTYTVTLTVTDNGGATGTTTRTVTVTSPPPPPIVLTVTASKVKSDWTANLSWTGATGTNVDVYRNGALLKTVANTGSTTDSGKGSSANAYRVCQAGTQTCSNTVTP